MNVILFLVWIPAIYFLLASNSSIPAKAVSDSFHSNKKESLFSKLAAPFSKLALRYVRLSPEKENALAVELRTVGMVETPAQFIANNIGLAVFIALIGSPIFFLYPLLGFSLPVIAYVVYQSESKSVSRKLQEKRTAIELELPRFSSTISTALEGDKSTDVLRILENYHKVAGIALKSELETTIADCKTGNLQNALRNFENRIQSHKLSELIRGLLSVSYGDNQSIYFQIKENEFRQEYREIRKREIEARPNKLTGISLITMLCAVALVVIALGSDLLASVQSMF